MDTPEFKVAKTAIVPIKDLKPHPDNPRFIRDEGFERLKKSMSEFTDMVGVKAVTINKANIILAGNMRVRAAKELGWKTLPAVIAEFGTPEQEREFLIKDNTHFGEFDMEVIGNEWTDQPLDDWGIFTYDVPDEMNGTNEVDVDGFADEMTIKLKYTEENYTKVKKKLAEIADSPEQAVLDLLK